MNIITSAVLEHVTKDEKDETFLDTIMMEGLAEYAVYERFGSSLTAEWTSYYTPEQLDFLFEKESSRTSD